MGSLSVWETSSQSSMSPAGSYSVLSSLSRLASTVLVRAPASVPGSPQSAALVLPCSPGPLPTGRDSKDNPEAMEEFKKFVKSKGFREENITVPELLGEL